MALLKKKTKSIPLVSDILSVFTDTIKQLQEVDEAQEAELTKISEEQARIESRRASAIIEQSLARTAKTNIEKILFTEDSNG